MHIVSRKTFQECCLRNSIDVAIILILYEGIHILPYHHLLLCVSIMFIQLQFNNLQLNATVMCLQLCVYNYIRKSMLIENIACVIILTVRVLDSFDKISRKDKWSDNASYFI